MNPPLAGPEGVSLTSALDGSNCVHSQYRSTTSLIRKCPPHRALTFHMTGTTEVESVLVLHFSIFNPAPTFCKLTSNG